MANEIYVKIEELCKRINSYSEKDISVKNQVKTNIYIEKVSKLINMIEIAMNNPNLPNTSIIEEVDTINEKPISEDKYNPYSNDFYYKDKLQQLDGDINKLIKELKAEDEIGYRNAYIIKEIEKNINNKKDRVPDETISKNNKKNDKLTVKNKVGIWERIKGIFR